MSHITIPLCSQPWFVGVVASAVVIALAYLLFRATPKERRPLLATICGVVILFEIAVTHLYLEFILETWSLSESLPIHLCRVCFIVAGLGLITRHQLLYEWSAYLGLPSGVHSILTPELTQGDSAWMLINYYLSHSLLIAVPVLMSVFFEMKPRRKAMVHVFLAVNAFAVLVFSINTILESNYMYLAEKPLAASPLLVGPWPWYILGLEVAAVVHLGLMDAIFRVRPFGIMRA